MLGGYVSFVHELSALAGTILRQWVVAITCAFVLGSWHAHTWCDHDGDGDSTIFRTQAKYFCLSQETRCNSLNEHAKQLKTKDIFLLRAQQESTHTRKHTNTEPRRSTYTRPLMLRATTTVYIYSNCFEAFFFLLSLSLFLSLPSCGRAVWSNVLRFATEHNSICSLRIEIHVLTS